MTMDHTELYEMLGVSKDSTYADIKKNYRKLAKEFHPDKNPEAGDKFKEISFAYEVLSDPEKRKTYDRFGLKGLQEGSDGFSDVPDFFSQLFGESHCQHGRRESYNVRVRLMVTLEEIYNGNVSKIVEFNRTEYCQQCEGKGGDAGTFEDCKECDGSGYFKSIHARGILGGFQSVCIACNGRGTKINEEHCCSKCSGKGVHEVTQTQEVTIEKGAPNYLKIPFASEGNQPIVGERGDLIVTLVQEDHPTFMRQQNDLYLRNVHLSLIEALCGFTYVFQHLDGRSICINRTEGIRHGDRKVIRGEGMPLRNNPFEKGDLFMEFRIDFPDSGFATPEQLAILEEVLPPREPFVMPENAEEVEMVDSQPFSTDGGTGAYCDDDEDDYAGGPQFEGVQCQTA